MMFLVVNFVHSHDLISSNIKLQYSKLIEFSFGTAELQLSVVQKQDSKSLFRMHLIFCPR